MRLYTRNLGTACMQCCRGQKRASDSLLLVLTSRISVCLCTLRIGPSSLEGQPMLKTVKPSLQPLSDYFPQQTKVMILPNSNLVNQWDSIEIIYGNIDSIEIIYGSIGVRLCIRTGSNSSAAPLGKAHSDAVSLELSGRQLMVCESGLCSPAGQSAPATVLYCCYNFAEWPLWVL